MLELSYQSSAHTRAHALTEIWTQAVAGLSIEATLLQLQRRDGALRLPIISVAASTLVFWLPSCPLRDGSQDAEHMLARVRARARHPAPAGGGG